MKTCFVVMGFNRKTDYQTGRTLDLDKTYRILIKPTVVEAGLACVRADEIVHAGVIDVPMYEHLLEADLVIADLSTSNPNALYELGVRHALRPFATIVIAESKLQYAFNVAHTAIRSYQHLGDAIDYEEVLRFRKELDQAIRTVLERQEKDSPVYTYLPELRPPGLASGRGAVPMTTRSGAVETPVPPPQAQMADADAAIARGDYGAAKSLLSTALAARSPDRPRTADDDYLVQRLALATARADSPDRVAALTEAQAMMAVLRPAQSHDPETLALWGETAVALWTTTRERQHLEGAIAAYERAFFLRGDPEDGTTLAFLLNVRGSISEPAEAIADFVQARRLRDRVIRVSDRPTPPVPGPDAEAVDEANRRVYRRLAVLAEAYLGIGDRERSASLLEEAMALPVAPELKSATTGRMAALTTLLSESPLRYLAV
jgi:tetratricopeptide (TPR) repeat protein